MVVSTHVFLLGGEFRSNVRYLCSVRAFMFSSVIFFDQVNATLAKSSFTNCRPNPLRHRALGSRSLLLRAGGACHMTLRCCPVRNVSSQLRVMVASSTIQSFRLAVVGQGGTPTGGEEALIDLVRKRLRASLVKDADWAVRRQFVHGLVPLVSYLSSFCGGRQRFHAPVCAGPRRRGLRVVQGRGRSHSSGQAVRQYCGFGPGVATGGHGASCSSSRRDLGHSGELVHRP